MAGGGTLGGGNLSLGPALSCESCEEEGDDDDEEEGLRVSKGFLPANKWLTGLIPDEEVDDERILLAEVERLEEAESTDPRRPLEVATVQNIT